MTLIASKIFLSWIFIFLSIFTNMIGQYSLKKSLLNHPEIDVNSLDNIINLMKTMITNKLFWFGFICFGLTFIFWLLGIKKLPLSTAYPATAISIVLIILMSKFSLQENITKLHFFGIFFVIVGVLLIAYSSFKT
jgi:multidrug transporter EmrE-like cation transporter